MSADLLREAAAAIREDYVARWATADGRLIDPFMFAVADLLDDQAWVRELCARAGARPLDRTTSVVDRVARAYLGRTS